MAWSETSRGCRTPEAKSSNCWRANSSTDARGAVPYARNMTSRNSRQRSSFLSRKALLQLLTKALDLALTERPNEFTQRPKPQPAARTTAGQIRVVANSGR